MTIAVLGPSNSSPCFLKTCSETQSTVARVRTQLEGLPEPCRPMAGGVVEGFGGHRDGAVRVRLLQQLRVQGVSNHQPAASGSSHQQSALDTIPPLRHLSVKHISSTVDEPCSHCSGTSSRLSLNTRCGSYPSYSV